jgi:hypothetical protein
MKNEVGLKGWKNSRITKFSNLENWVKILVFGASWALWHSGERFYVTKFKIQNFTQL